MTPVLVLGATGYVGARLVPRLLDEGYAVRVLTRRPAGVAERDWAEKVEVIEGDASSPDSMRSAMADVEIVYYLLHSMDGHGDFAERDRRLAELAGRTAYDAGVRRIVYLSGLHPTGPLSSHLASRVEVGDLLMASGAPTSVVQAAVIIGAGSASFEMLRHLTVRLPAMVAPKWLDNRIQPIAVADVLDHLIAAARVPESENRTYDIGGPDVLTYREMIQRFAAIAGIPQRRILTVPVLTPRLASHWVGFVTPVPTGVAKPLVGSLVHEVICQESDLSASMGREPGDLLGYDEAVHAALVGERDDPLPEPGTVDPARLTAADPRWAGRADGLERLPLPGVVRKRLPQAAPRRASK